MASEQCYYYYYHNQRPPYNHHHHHYYDYSSSDDDYRRQSGGHEQPHQQPLPLHLCFFLAILFLFLTFSWYLSYESAVESLFDGVKFALMLLPVIFLLALHCLSGVDRSWASLLVPLGEGGEGSHGHGGSPWGVACVLLLLIFMAAYRSSFRDGWFPLSSR